MTEAPSKRTSTSRVDPEPTHVGSKKDEDFEILLCSISRQTKGPVVVTVEELSEEVTERQAIRNELVPTIVPARIAPAGSLQSQRKSTDPKDILSGSPVETVSLAGLLEQSLTT